MACTGVAKQLLAIMKKMAGWLGIEYGAGNGVRGQRKQWPVGGSWQHAKAEKLKWHLKRNTLAKSINIWNMKMKAAGIISAKWRNQLA
jgi:hypothetical protein